MTGRELLCAVLLLGGCPRVSPPPLPPSHAPQARFGNVEVEGAPDDPAQDRLHEELDDFEASMTEGDPELASEMRARHQPANAPWVGQAVSALPPSQLLQSSAERCSYSSVAVVVTASTGEQVFGQLLVYPVDDRGTGPAGRGDYFIQVPDSQIAATSGGRTALAYESYRTVDGVERYAWAIWLNERPNVCH